MNVVSLFESIDNKWFELIRFSSLLDCNLYKK